RSAGGRGEGGSSGFALLRTLGFRNSAGGEGRPMATTGWQSLFFDALVVALSQACDGGKKRWYASTLELQLASLDICRVCRSISTLHVRVKDQAPRSLWYPHEVQTRPERRGSKICTSSLAPIL
ncbi:unnamed protein product, partial [Ectocarpus fasciculatus]